MLKVRRLLNVIKWVNKTLLTLSLSFSLYYINSPLLWFYFGSLSRLPVITFKLIGHISFSDATQASFGNHQKTQKLEIKSSWSLIKGNKVFNESTTAMQRTLSIRISFYTCRRAQRVLFSWLLRLCWCHRLLLLPDLSSVLTGCFWMAGRPRSPSGSSLQLSDWRTWSRADRSSIFPSPPDDL